MWLTVGESHAGIVARTRERVLELDARLDGTKEDYSSMDMTDGPGLFRMSDNACRCVSEVRLYDLTPSTLLWPVLSITCCSSTPD